MQAGHLPTRVVDRLIDYIPQHMYSTCKLVSTFASNEKFVNAVLLTPYHNDDLLITPASINDDVICDAIRRHDDEFCTYAFKTIAAEHSKMMAFECEGNPVYEHGKGVMMINTYRRFNTFWEHAVCYGTIKILDALQAAEPRTSDTTHPFVYVVMKAQHDISIPNDDLIINWISQHCMSNLISDNADWIAKRMIVVRNIVMLECIYRVDNALLLIKTMDYHHAYLQDQIIHAIKQQPDVLAWAKSKTWPEWITKALNQ
jgi:hypothetical protein